MLLFIFVALHWWWFHMHYQRHSTEALRESVCVKEERDRAKEKEREREKENVSEWVKEWVKEKESEREWKRESWVYPTCQDYPTPRAALLSCLRRGVTYPLHRGWTLTHTALTDAARTLCCGKREGRADWWVDRWLIDWLIDELSGWFDGWLVWWMEGWMGWFDGWLIIVDWCVEWIDNWLIDWLVVFVNNSVCSVCRYICVKNYKEDRRKDRTVLIVLCLFETKGIY